MSRQQAIAAAQIGFPRYFKIAGHWINSYKVLLCVGLYVGILASAVVAQWAGLSPLRVGLGSLLCAIAGMAGARIYFLLTFAGRYFRTQSRSEIWNSESGGWSVMGGLLPMIPVSIVWAWAVDLPLVRYWDCMGAGILAGGFWIRLGCVFNGCCCGRETAAWCGVRLHDVRGVSKRRVPVQFLEMGWWLLGTMLFLELWPREFTAGSYALGVIGFYGIGRFWLEPLRENPDLLWGRVRLNQVVAVLLVIGAAIGLILV